MIKRTLIILIFASTLFFPQAKINFVWINSPQIENITEFSNKLNEIENAGKDFVIISGKIFGKQKQYKNLKKAIDDLQIPVKILPSVNDISEPQNFLNYVENFDGINFLLKKNRFLFIGIKSENLFDKNFAFFKKEDLAWLKDELSSLPNDSLQVILFTDNEPSQILNFTDLQNLLQKNFFETIFLNQKPNEISKKYYFVFPYQNQKIANVQISRDSLIVSFNNVEIFHQRFIHKHSDTTEKSALKLFTLDKSKLKPVWNFSIPASVFNSAISYKKRFYIADNTGILTCIDKDGTTFWDYDLFGDVVSSPVAKDNFIVASTLQGDITTLNALSGESLQTIGFDAPVVSNLIITEYPWQINTMSPKKTNSKAAVVFATNDGTIHCLDVETLENIWDAKIETTYDKCKLFNVNNQIVFVTENSIVALDKKNGAVIWQRKFDEKISTNITYGKNDLFCWTNNSLISFDIKLGTKNWEVLKYKPRKVFLSKNRKTLYIIDEKGNLIFAKSNNGKYIKKFPLNLNSQNIYVSNVGKNLLIAGGNKIFRIRNAKKYTDICNSKFPISTFVNLTNGKIFLGDANGNFTLVKYIEHK